jgi:hypothetical protein
MMFQDPQKDVERKEQTIKALKDLHRNIVQLNHAVAETFPKGKHRHNVQNALAEFRGVVHKEYGRLTIDGEETIHEPTHDE